MNQEIIELTEETTEQGVSRRGFIKGAIAASAAVSSSNYLFRGNGGTALAQSPAAGAVERLITLNINGRSRRVLRRTDRGLAADAPRGAEACRSR